MSLGPGSRLGPYEVLSPLGAGGMGEVYRARDTRLGREVAVKVLNDAFVADPDRLARFEREAKLLASLNHPSIAAIYGLEPAGSHQALVMELVEGPTLADRIAAGSVPIDEALPIAKQIAEALEFAHERGVVHRDLKPANVKVRADGTVKVLDFGLAKAIEGDALAPGASQLSQSPTLTQRATMVGTIVGTAAYMAPEQAKGRAVDRRADVWAFGVILFEMLTGRQLFEGETVSETLASVMKDEVPWGRLPGALPARVRRLLERCLTRDPKLRLQSMGEARIAIDDAGSGPDVAAGATSGAAPASARAMTWLAGAAALLALAFAAAWLVTLRGRPAPETRKYPLSLHAGSPGDVSEATISPDGHAIAFYVGDTLFVRSLITLETRALSEANSGVMRPFWSPDGRDLAFTDGQRLLRVPIAGGAVWPICQLPAGPVGGTGGSWASDGRILFALGSGGLYEVAASGGDAREVLPLDSLSSDYHEPLVLPGGRGVVFSRHRLGGAPDNLCLFDGKAWHEVLRVAGASVARPAWSKSGHILFHRTGTNPGLWALPFSLARGRATGPPFLVVADGAGPSMTEGGTLVYSAGVLASDAHPRAVWVDYHGTVLDTLSEPLPDCYEAALAPDGRRAAVVITEAGNRDVWMLDLERRTKTRLTFGTGTQTEPAWSADGREIFYDDDDSGGVAVISASGGGTPRHIGPGFQPEVSRDGNSIVFVSPGRGTKNDIFVRRLGADTTAKAIVRGPSDDMRPEVAPRGGYMAYHSDEGGRTEVYVTRFPSGEGRWQVSVHGGRRPRWSAGGDHLFYQSPDGSLLLEADVQLGDVPTIGVPRVLFDMDKSNLKSWGARNWDIHPDGKRILALSLPARMTQKWGVIAVENWQQEFAKNPGVNP